MTIFFSPTQQAEIFDRFYDNDTTTAAIVDIHIGVRAPYLERVANLAFLNKDIQFFVNNDGFACWGEPRGTDINDDETFHVVLRVRDVEAAIKTIKVVFPEEHMLQTFFDAMNVAGRTQNYEWQMDLLVVTDPDDWSKRIDTRKAL